MGGLNAEVGSDTILLGYVMRRHVLGDWNGRTFEYMASHKVSWDLTGRQQTSNQIEHITITGGVGSCLLNVCNKIVGN